MLKSIITEQGPKAAPGHGPRKRGLNSKIHLAVEAHGMPVRVLIASGATADCSQAVSLIENIEAEALPADRGYDSDAVVGYAKEAGMEVVIPPRQTRKVRFVQATAFGGKRFSGIETRAGRRNSLC